MANILAVGVATIDWIQVVDRYPAADDEVRAEQQSLCRGGNATNTLAVLSQLGHTCSWLGTLADDAFAALITADLDRYHIDYRYCPVIPGSQSPASHILLSRQQASRNIVHYRDLHELREADAAAIDFACYDWLHVEGRNVGTTLAMLKQARSIAPGITISIELEKPRDDIEQLYPYADLLIAGRNFANATGHDTAASFFMMLAAQQVRPVELVCAWGEKGAYGIDAAGECIHAPAGLLDAVVDTRAAGDVFNAAYIDARIRGEELASALEAAVALSGRKCSQPGIDGLA